MTDLPSRWPCQLSQPPHEPALVGAAQHTHGSPSAPSGSAHSAGGLRNDAHHRTVHTEVELLMPAELDAEPGNEHPRSAHWQLEASAQAAAQVRHALDAVLEQWGLSEDARDAAVLVAYELIANGIDYGTENGADRLLLSA